MADKPQSAELLNGMIVLTMCSGSEVRFPAVLNPRLARGTPQEFANIELSRSECTGPIWTKPCQSTADWPEVARVGADFSGWSEGPMHRRTPRRKEPRPWKSRLSEHKSQVLFLWQVQESVQWSHELCPSSVGND